MTEYNKVKIIALIKDVVAFCVGVITFIVWMWILAKR